MEWQERPVVEREPGRRPIVVLALLAPVVFLLHVAEEAPGFVPWINSLMDPDISQPSFLRVNAGCFVITLAVSLALAATREWGAGLVSLAWFGFLFFANAIFHLVATAVHGRYSPGAVTSLVLYLPHFAALFALLVRRLGIPALGAAAVTLLGAAPMAVHGYLIVFRGSRLF
jgi:hypothetical protein